MPQWGQRQAGALPAPGAPGNVLTSDGVSWSSQPPSGGGAGYDHTQAVAASTWTVNHNLGYVPVVEVRDVLGRVIAGAGIAHISALTCTIDFAAAVAGTARCV